MKCGSAPVDLGYIDVDHSEMMFWQYCPIGRPGDNLGTVLWQTPENLLAFHPLIAAAYVAENKNPTPRYIYITVKTLYVSGEYIGNRPGWHIDGFGTDDTNYIWYDRAPTEFIEGTFDIPEDCDGSLQKMQELGSIHDNFVYGCKKLLKLDPTVIHRCPSGFSAGMRSFVKISFSNDVYDLVGNSINHRMLDLKPTAQRQLERNHPSSKHR